MDLISKKIVKRDILSIAVRSESIAIRSESIAIRNQSISEEFMENAICSYPSIGEARVRNIVRDLDTQDFAMDWELEED